MFSLHFSHFARDTQISGMLCNFCDMKMNVRQGQEESGYKILYIPLDFLHIQLQTCSCWCCDKLPWPERLKLTSLFSYSSRGPFYIMEPEHCAPSRCCRSEFLSLPSHIRGLLTSSASWSPSSIFRSRQASILGLVQLCPLVSITSPTSAWLTLPAFFLYGPSGPFCGYQTIPDNLPSHNLHQSTSASPLRRLGLPSHVTGMRTCPSFGVGVLLSLPQPWWLLKMDTIFYPPFLHHFCLFLFPFFTGLNF